MGDGIGYPGNARGLKAFSLLFVILAAISLLLVHASSYDPPVSFILLYLAASVGIVVAGVVVPLLPARQFTLGFCGGVYALYAAVTAMMVFFTGGPSSELYVIFFPLLVASTLHGAWRVVLAVLTAALFFYALAMLPGLLESGAGEEVASSVFYRLGALGLTGLFLAYASRGVVGAADTPEETLEDEGAVLLERVEGEISSSRGAPVAVILVDPGGVRDVDLLLDRVDARIGEPFSLEDGDLFGLVVGGVDDGGAESAARRALAAASSLGAEETRAGAAIYPRDARSAEDLLLAAGRALEASFEVEGPSAIVLAGRDAREGPYRAAR
ncbi:MAG: Glutamate synthase domain 2 [uncultured Rubrobacteraceae bacterium]|uniref:Glutamate synthase domain 2 n=1 Tax=uncultured Rubrobacteraceae bacterium TaxID=349277 RepID=A0A6J4SSR7_9ACTN|nr:MAG: Glutamate synthase domain 2 [uncultured Rubrobacteraceae bacterium]